MHQHINLFLLLLFGIFVNNYVMSQFLGICPFLGVSKKVETSTFMVLAVIFVIVIACAATFVIYNLILVPLGVTYLYTIAFILVIASLVQLVEMFLKKSSPDLYQSLGVYLPLITTNCAVLGVAVVNMQNNYTFAQAIVNGVGGAVGFAFSIIVFAGIRERMEHNKIPKAFNGFPMAFVSASIMSIAFLGFQGLIKI